MNSDEPVRELIFENGAVGYAGPGNSFSLTAPDGGDIKLVSERHLSGNEQKDIQQLMEQSRFKKGELRRGKWRLIDKSNDELVDENIITEDKKPKRSKT